MLDSTHILTFHIRSQTLRRFLIFWWSLVLAAPLSFQGQRSLPKTIGTTFIANGRRGMRSICFPVIGLTGRGRRFNDDSSGLGRAHFSGSSYWWWPSSRCRHHKKACRRAARWGECRCRGHGPRVARLTGPVGNGLAGLIKTSAPRGGDPGRGQGRGHRRGPIVLTSILVFASSQ